VNATIAARHFPNVTVLMVAAGSKKLSAVKLLVEAGASLAAKDANGETALAYAKRSGGKRVVAYLETAFERAGAHAGLTLHEAAQNGAAARARELLQQGAAVDQTDKDGATALMLAARKGDADIVQLLCEAGAGVDRSDAAGKNLWDYALGFDARPEVVRCLIEHGLDPNQSDLSGMPPLIRTAALGGDHVTEVMRVLLESGANVEATFTPRVPPEMAAQLARLRALGSKLGQGIEGTFTALEYAKRTRNRKAYEFLKQYSGAAADAYDAAVDELRQLAGKSDAAFDQEAERIGAALQARPQPWKKRKGVYHYFAKLPAQDAPPDRRRTAAAQEPEANGLLERLQSEARTKGYTLVYTETDWQGKGLTRLLLFPTPHEMACIAACGTNADNYGMGPREIVNWCTETQTSHPFTVMGAGFDFMELKFSRPVANAEALARRIAVFCPDCEIDSNDSAAIATFARELAAQGTCFFWWD
jgi:ankyrin repeat protein